MPPLPWYARLHCGLVVQEHRLELPFEGVQSRIRELRHQLELFLRLGLLFFAVIKQIRYSTCSCTHLEVIAERSLRIINADVIAQRETKSNEE